MVLHERFRDAILLLLINSIRDDRTIVAVFIPLRQSRQSVLYWLRVGEGDEDYLGS